MDLNTVSEVARPSTRDDIPHWCDSDAWLAGGTWLFSEPQPAVRRLIDLEQLRWEPLQVSETGLAIAATCTISQLYGLSAPGEWSAAPLIRQCCRSLLASFKIWNTASVGGNICMSLPAGAMISLTAALEGVCTIWPHDGGERCVGVVDFVTGVQQNVLGPGDLLRSINLPASALQKRTSFRRMSLTHLGRSSVLLIGVVCPLEGSFALTVTAATVRPVRIEFPGVPAADQLRSKLREAIPDALYLDDVHGTPAYRKHMTFYFAEEIRSELSAGGGS
ncbi:MAG: FAD binding domain-containing protein [Desulfomonile tiedjei]|nr:FAD binding domain-containing protein [Desulfomonile tiedjei]